METINQIAEIDFIGWLLTGLLLMSIGIAIYKIVAEFLNIINKPIGAMKQRKEDHELIMKNALAIKELSEHHEHDAKKLDEHDEKITSDLTVFMSEMRGEIKKIADNRTRDREQSFGIQKDLTNSIKSIVETDKTRDKQIDSLMLAQREMLADRINRKYKYYVSINGIPEDELDEFVNLHAAYKLCGGNSSGDAKFDYCMNHLPVLPVETKLVIKHE